MTAHSAVELEGGEPADHLGDRNLELSGDFRGVHGEDVGQVGEDPVALSRKRKTQVRGGGERVVENLAAMPQCREDVACVLHQRGAVAYEPVRADGEGREDAPRHSHYLFM